MQRRRRVGSSQGELFPRSKRPTISLDEKHRLVVMTDALDWTALEELVETIRRSKLKSAAGRPPQLRALIGAVLFRATRKAPYRDTEDQIRHYGPARYLCGLTETDWTPDGNTIQDFEQLLGEDGVAALNEHVVDRAVEEKFADPSVMVADTTAQEAAIPHPNEMGLMTAFATAVCAASKHVGGALKGFVQKAAGTFAAMKKKLREYRLFAKDKTREVKNQMVMAVTKLVEKIQRGVDVALKQVDAQKQRLTRYGKVAWSKIQHVQQTMKKLLPQIRHWLKTGHVAAGKIINLWLPELYSIVRGKVGKPVEFGLTWGIRRLRGGYVLATMARDKRELQDVRFAVSAVDEHIAQFGKPPRSYAYDRGGYSRDNITELRRKGVRNIGLAPRGRTEWQVSDKMRDELFRERAQVEGSIGTIKSNRYGFNRPGAHSAEMMGVGGQRAVLGLNLTKFTRQIAARDGIAVMG